MDGHVKEAAAAQYTLSLVLPAYNEAEGIAQAVIEADDALAALAGEYEVLVVDDGSRDGTAAVVAELARGRPHVRLLRHESNQGYGAALRTGFEAARYDRVAFTDADCQFHLADLNLLLPLTDGAPIAAGYRVDRQDPVRRRFISWGYNTLVRGLLGTRVRDCDCALKVFRREALRDILPASRGFFVNTEMLTRARQQGYEVAEVGVRHRPRVRGTSKVSLGDVPRVLATLLPFWWSQVLFPANRGEAATPSGPTRREERTCFAILFVVALLLFFSRLGCPLQEPEETRYAEVPRQMLEAGSLTVPVLHGLPYYDKPPLLYWLVMGSYRLFGVGDQAARLVTSLAGFLTVLFTYFWGRRTVGGRAAFAGAMVLCLSPRFLYLGRLLTMNGLLCLWVTVAAGCAHLAVSQGGYRRGWWLLSAVACALGVLTKGPVALVLVAVPVVTLCLLDPRCVRPRGRHWLAYLGVTAAVVAPWFVAVEIEEPGFFWYFFVRHNVVRFAAPFDHAKPFWSYVPEVALGMLPWSLLLVPLVRSLFRFEAGPVSRRPAGLGYFLLAAAWGFLFYSLAGSKRPGYILPVMPPLALALGCTVDRLLAAAAAEPIRAVAAATRIAYRFLLVLLAGGIGALLFAGREAILRPNLALELGVGLAIAFAFVVRRVGQWRPAAAWGACAATAFVLFLGAIYLVLPGYARRFSMRGQVRPLAAVAGDASVPVVCYPRHWDSIPFYLNRDDVRVYTRTDRRQLLQDLRDRPRTLAFIKSDRSLDEFLHDLPGSLEFVPDGRQGNVTVGWVVPRPEVPLTLFAGGE